MPLQSLPNELWLEIFHWAIFSPSDAYTSIYHPFCDSYGKSDDISNLKMKSTLVLICRLWYDLAIGMLYKDLSIRQGPCQTGLRTALQNMERNNGRMVRRVVLPYDSTVTDHGAQLSGSIEILKLCRDLEVLIRPRTYQYAMRTLTFDFDAETMTFPSLKRLEWWHNNEAERSGGINSLAAVLDNVPNLEYLFIGGAVGMHSTMLKSDILDLPRLKTLRLFSVSGILLHQICSRMSFPALSHVVIDSVVNQGDMQHFWQTRASEIKTVEFGKHMRFMMGDEVTQCLELSPNVQDVNYYLFFTSPPRFTGVHHSVYTIGLNTAINMALTEEATWEHIEKHFSFFLGPSLPSLRHVKLYGDWAQFVNEERFLPYRNGLFNRRCTIMHQPS